MRCQMLATKIDPRSHLIDNEKSGLNPNVTSISCEVRNKTMSDSEISCVLP